MAWLLRDGKVLATLEVADSAGARARGLLGRDGIEGAILLRPARSVHTLRMRFPIDVAYCDRELRVLRVTTMQRNRVGLPVRRSRSVIEAEAGAMQKWGVCVGDVLEVRDGDGPEVPGAVGSGNGGNGGPEPDG